MIKTCFMWFIASELYFLKWVSRTGGRLKWGAGAVAFGCFQSVLHVNCHMQNM